MNRTDQHAHTGRAANGADEVHALRARIAELEHQAVAARLAEQALRESEELNRRILQSMQGGLVQIGLDGVFISANVEAIRILRLRKDAVTQTLVEDFGPKSIYEDGTPYAVEDYPVSYCLRTGKPHPPVLIGLRFPDGTETWAVYSAAPILDPQTGKPTSAVVAFIDVTEQRRMQQSLQASEEKYRTLIETTATGYVVVDMQGRVLDANAEYVRQTGHNRLDEIRGRDVMEWTAPHDLERNAREVEKCAKSGSVQNLEIDYVDRAGRITPIEINARVVDAEGGKVMLALCRDISQRREAEQAIKASHEWFESLVHNVDGIVWEADATTFRFSFVSDKAEELLGYPTEQWINEPDFWLNHLHPEDRNAAMNFCIQATREGRDHQFEYRMIAKDGSALWLRDIVSVVSDGGQPMKLRGLMVDITASKKSQDSLRQSADTQRIMLSELDHRVRNNLASLAALIDISRRHGQDVNEFAESVKGRVLAMSAVHSLLSRARWFAINLRSLIHTLIPVDLHEQVAVDGDNVLIAPRQATAMGMVLQELTANSLKYGALHAGSGRVTIAWTVEMTDQTGERRLILSWTETGGPTILTPPHHGQGTELITGFARTELRGTANLTYPREGAAHRFVLLLDPVG